MCALTWVVFVPRASFPPTLSSGSSPSPTWQLAGYIACTKLPDDVQSSWNIQMRSFKIYGIWPHTDRHYIHTTSANAVTLVWGEPALVWGSLRLAPISIPVKELKLLVWITDFSQLNLTYQDLFCTRLPPKCFNHENINDLSYLIMVDEHRIFTNTASSYIFFAWVFLLFAHGGFYQ